MRGSKSIEELIISSIHHSTINPLHQSYPIHHSTIHHSTIHHSTIHHSTIHHSTINHLHQSYPFHPSTSIHSILDRDLPRLLDMVNNSKKSMEVRGRVNCWGKEESIPISRSSYTFHPSKLNHLFMSADSIYHPLPLLCLCRYDDKPPINQSTSKH